ncbi:alpha/beta fold hydrolase [Microbacterium allomyrinae]|uniref:Alpha/beta fold hydrolase n=1 Tax=Microbacterium allomyrinae TaxID=2830666 RepID=A0A9X1LWC1_9MICO|nr:alpha/beta fold hydrolase [Microbacterium allomyrinae]MCC2033187.1 alpha/beta fold hydrolase [Microbacterium allomyrinae]
MSQASGGPLVPATLRGHFWVGSETRATDAGTVPFGQMYVEWESPARETGQLPVVLVHGGGGQGLDFLQTPDGRPGWAPLLVAAGHPVYVVDRPGHGRSPHDPNVLGPMAPSMPIESWLDVMLPEAFAPLRTQWSGAREVEDPVVRHLTSSSGPMLADWEQMHLLEQRRLAELLDRIGPAILICHSAGGPAGYLATDARPELVRALVAVETIGPPFLKRPGVSLDWGLACAPLVFDPPATRASELRLSIDGTGPVPLVLQEEPARRLPNLARVPIAVVTGEASAFTLFDGHLMAFLEQAGCDAELLRLERHGVRGNGHMMMLEANNVEVLGVILYWLERNALAA